MTAIKRTILVAMTLVLGAAVATTPSQALSGKCTSGNSVKVGVRYTCVAKKWQVSALRGTVVALAASSLTDVAPALE